MRLKAIILENFRAYHQQVYIPLGNLTAFIGRNDIGKSTILEALDIFFEGGTIKIDKNDACIHGDTGNVVIGCVFDELPDELILDTTSETNLRDEYLLNQDGDLEIHKIFDCTKGKISASIFAIAYHPTTNEYHDLLSLKQSALRERCKRLSINLDNLDQRKNSELRRAIWKNLNQDDLQLKVRKISLDKDDSKDIWGKISENLPLYALFQSDRSSNDGDSEVQDPMKIAIKQAIAKVQEKIDEIKKIVEEEVTDVATRTLDKLAEMDSDLAKSLKPIFTTEPQWDRFVFKLEGDDGIPINKRGSGIRRLILLNFFRAEAERKANTDNKQSVIYAIEEPETSQHPDYQKMLIEALLDLVEKPNCQIIITTHVPALAGMVPIEYLRYIERVDDQIKIEHGTIRNNSDVFKKIATTLGISPSPHHPKVIFCVEGIHDVNFWYGISKLIHQTRPDLPDLSTDSRIVTVAVGGGNLKYWIEYHYLENFKIPEIHIYDKDALAKYQIECDKVNQRTNGSWATLTTKRTIENYLHKDAIYDVLNVTVPFQDTDDVPMLVAQAMENSKRWSGLGDKHKKLLANKQKHPLNKEVIQKMTYARLQSSDLNNDIITWLEKIASYL